MARLLIARPGHVYLATYEAVANKFAIIHDLAVPGCPSWLAVDHARSLAYTVDEDSHKFHRFHLDPFSGIPFSQMLTVDTASPGAVYLAFSQDKQRLLGAAFAGGAVDVWDVSDGLGLEKTIVSDGKPGPVAHIQDAPHPHQVLLDPTGRFYVVLDLGTDEILVLDSKDDAFTISSRVTVGPPGSGPRHESEFALVLFERALDGGIKEPPKLRVEMSEFMDEAEMKAKPENGPKFIMEL
ncbi:hypothetical protein ARSEF4850_006295 [Beauveria asiatica]